MSVCCAFPLDISCKNPVGCKNLTRRAASQKYLVLGRSWMSKRLLALGAILYFTGFVNTQSYSYAMMQKLSPEQRNEAIKYGKMGVRKEVTEFIKEWSVDGGRNGFAFITTEFLALAYAARQAALQPAELTNFEIEDALSQSRGKLVFRVTTYGNTMDFSKENTAVIETGGKTIPATFWTNGEGEAYDDGKGQPAFIADSDFFFPAEGIDPNSRITLIIQDKDGKAVAQFKFDLSKVR